MNRHRAGAPAASPPPQPEWVPAPDPLDEPKAPTSWTSDVFSRFTTMVSRGTARPGAFIAAVAGIVIWGICGPFFGYSEGWQLTVNTGTTIITFLMVFIIQNGQYRDTLAIQIKLAELIRVNRLAKDSLLDLETLTPEELDQLRTGFEELAKAARDEEAGDCADGQAPTRSG